jgi:8-oxo-dGTP pyrophosphatase MutT (NUDIX family)
MQKIYFNDKPLFLIDDLSPKFQDLKSDPYTIYREGLNEGNMQEIIARMQSATSKAGIFFHKNTNELVDALKKKFTVIQAGGGFVKYRESHVLLIFRKGRWDLPKGKLDAGEKLEHCAVREVQEETGLGYVELCEKLIVTYHTYYEKEKHILKESHWFKMKSENLQKLIPQYAENIEECRWVDISNLDYYMNNTHPSIIDVVKASMDK